MTEAAEQALAAANAEIERLNKWWEESRASAADAGLALRELAKELAAADAIWNRRDAEQVAALDAARDRIALLEVGLREAIDRWEANTPYVSEFPRIAKARSLLGEQADG